MADTKISAETAASALDGTELYEAVQGGNNRKVTGAQIKTLTSAAPTITGPLNLTTTINYGGGAGTDNSPANSTIYAVAAASGVCSNTTAAYLNQFYYADNVDASAAANGLTSWYWVDDVGASSKKGRVAGSFKLQFTATPATPGANYVALASYASINVNLSGTGDIFGFNPKASAGASASFNQLVGEEVNAHALSGASYKDFILSQFVIESTHAQAGTEMNTGVLIAAQGNTVPRPDTLFQDGAYQGYPASSTNTTIFKCYPHTNSGLGPTIANGFDLSNYTAINGNILLGPQSNCSINGAGIATFTGISAPTLALGVAGVTLGRLTISGNSSGTITLQPQAAAGTYNWNYPTGAGSSGDILTSGGGGSTAMSWVTPIAINNLTDTWNNSGTTFTAIKMNVTDTASQSASLLLDLQISTVSKFNVRKDGTATAAVAVLTPSLTLGTVSSATGALHLANASSANLTTIQAGNAANTRTYTWPTDFGASGTVLTDAAGDGTLSWAAAAGGSNTYTHTLSGNVSAAAWTTTGVGLVGAAASFTDTSSSGTVAAMYVNRLGIPTILASSATTYTAAYGLWVEPPTASTNVTITEKFAAGFNGNISINNSASANAISFSSGSHPKLTDGISMVYFGPFNGQVYIGNTATVGLFFDGLGTVNTSAGYYSWTSSSSDSTTTVDTYIKRRAAAGIQLGTADVDTAPVAQTLSVQRPLAGGTSDVNGANFTIVGGLCKGAGTPGTMIFQSCITGSTGTVIATPAAAFTINNSSSTGLQFNSYGAGALNTDASGNIAATSDEGQKYIQGDFTAGLAEIQRIRPIRYKWREASGMETEHEYAGFGAHNVRDAIELATGITKEGHLTLQDRALLAACVNAIQELAARA